MFLDKMSAYAQPTDLTQNQMHTLCVGEPFIWETLLSFETLIKAIILALYFIDYKIQNAYDIQKHVSEQFSSKVDF